MNTTKGLELMGSFRHVALLFVHTLVVDYLFEKDSHSDSVFEHQF